MQLKNIGLLRGLIFSHSHIIRDKNPDMICIGCGGRNPNLVSNFGIPAQELYQYDHHGQFCKGFYGTTHDELYFITRAFFDNYVKEAKITMSSAVAKGESLIGKNVQGDRRLFEVETVNLYNKRSIVPCWFPKWARDIINDRGWVVLVENKIDYANVDEATEIVNSIQLNETYTAVVEGNVVKVGCQTFDIEQVREIIRIHDSL